MKKSRDVEEKINEEGNTSLIKILTVALALKKKQNRLQAKATLWSLQRQC